MRKILHILCFLSFLCLLPLSVRAQTQTNVTATITDSLGIPYSNGTVSVQLIPSGTNPTVNGGSILGTLNGSTDATGSFNISLWANANIVPAASTWQFTVCVSPGVQPPLGTGGQCTPPTAVTIAGATQSLSATLTAVAPNLTKVGLGSGSVTSVSATAPIVATPSPITGVGTISCPTCNTGTGTIAGTVSATHLIFASAANTAGDVLGSAVTAGTGATALTATAIGVTPLSVGPFSASQTAGLLDIHNGGTGSVSSPLTVRGSGTGSFDPAAQPALVNIEEENDAVAHLGLIVTNRTANIAKGATDSIINMEVGDTGLAQLCAGGAVGDSNNNYTCFLWDVSSGIAVSQPSSTGANAARVAFSIVGSSGETGNLLNFKSTIGGAVASFVDINGNYSAGTDNSLAGTVTLANSAAAAHTIFASGATTTNTIKGFATVPTTGDVVTCTVVATTCTLTDGGAPGGAPAFSAITGGTNTTAAMICGTGCSLSSVPQFNIGAVGTPGILGLKGTTSGTATFTAPAVAGTTTNPVVSSNNIQVPVGAVTTPSLGIGAGGSGIFSVGGGVTLEVTGVSQLAAFTNSIRVLPTAALGFASGSLDTNGLDAAFSRDAANVIDVGNGTAGDVTGTIKPGKYATGTNCNSSASPAVCGSAAAGMFTLAATTTSITVNTTAVTANSEIIVFNDDSLGTRLGVTCNTGIDSVLVSARIAATSFTVTGSAPVTNPNCYSYFIVN
jgi:hypothetical protein